MRLSYMPLCIFPMLLQGCGENETAIPSDPFLKLPIVALVDKQPLVERVKRLTRQLEQAYLSWEEEVTNSILAK